MEVDNDIVTSSSPKAFNDEYEKFLGGKTTTKLDATDDITVLSDSENAEQNRDLILAQKK